MRNKINNKLPSSINAPVTRRGFTIIEVIMALAIVSIALVSLMRLHLVSLRMAYTGRVTSQALMLAREKIAEQLATGFGQPTTDSGTEYKNNLDFHWRTEVTDAELPTINGIVLNDLRRISVEVSFKDGSRQKEVKLSTLVANRKL